MNGGCSSVRKKLHEYHDGELLMDEQCRVRAHVAGCDLCSSELARLSAMSAALRFAASERTMKVDRRDLEGAAAGVISRFRAEREESFPRTIERMFEDFHLVWAALGATAATLACLALTVGMFYTSRVERPDSLAANFSTGTNAYPVKMTNVRLPQYLAYGIVMPRQELDAIASLPAVDKDETLAVNATITREGRVADLQLLNTDSKSPNWNAIGQVLDSAARARFEPARSQGGAAVAVTDMVWLLEHLTVRPKARGEVHRLHPPRAVADLPTLASS